MSVGTAPSVSAASVSPPLTLTRDGLRAWLAALPDGHRVRLPVRHELTTPFYAMLTALKDDNGWRLTWGTESLTATCQSLDLDAVTAWLGAMLRILPVQALLPISPASH